jgi:DNA (cytosine-5)-methyltransferase 1
MDKIISSQEIIFELEKKIGDPSIDLVLNKNKQTERKSKFKFIDLFAGIGGFRLAFEKVGGKSVFTSEWDKNSQFTFYENFKELPKGDINAIKPNTIPDHNILLAGFPCQAFSIAGYRKGFEDTRGTLFFNIANILEEKNPPAFLLENVKGLVNHNMGDTLKRMKEILEVKLGYKVFVEILNSMTHANIPQNRERIFFVGIRKDKFHSNFNFPPKIDLIKTIHDCILYGKQEDKYYYDKNHKYYEELNKTVIKTDTIYQWRRKYVRENKSKVCPTLTANMGTGGHNVPIIKDNYGIRKLTPRECANFQGFPKNYKLPKISDSKLYYQIGNSVTVPLIERIAKNMVKYLDYI